MQGHSKKSSSYEATKSDWIVSFIKYQAGKEILVVNDINTKDFLNKYTGDFAD